MLIKGSEIRKLIREELKRSMMREVDSDNDGIDDLYDRNPSDNTNKDQPGDRLLKPDEIKKLKEKLSFISSNIPFTGKDIASKLDKSTDTIGTDDEAVIKAFYDKHKEKIKGALKIDDAKFGTDYPDGKTADVKMLKYISGMASRINPYVVKIQKIIKAPITGRWGDNDTTQQKWKEFLSSRRPQVLDADNKPIDESQYILKWATTAPTIATVNDVAVKLEPNAKGALEFLRTIENNRIYKRVSFEPANSTGSVVLPKEPEASPGNVTPVGSEGKDLAQQLKDLRRQEAEIRKQIREKRPNILNKIFNKK